jgi:hypothetical protein
MTSVTFICWFRGVSCGLMSDKGVSAENGQQNTLRESRNESAAPASCDSKQAPSAEAKVRPAHYTDLQSAVRFPIKLPICLKSKSGENHTETQNISANGVLFRIDAEMPVGAPIDFTISLPADVVGAEADVQLDCRGRVVRNLDEEGRRGVGVVIDEYRFERR